MKFITTVLLFTGIALAAPPNPALDRSPLEARSCSSSASICVNRCCASRTCNGYFNCGRSFCNILEECVCKCQYN